MIGKYILPAVRASVAELMKSTYGWRQEDIADGLGVVQVAVSKYLNEKYSSDVMKIRNYIIKNGLGKEIARSLSEGRSSSEIHAEIDRLCASLASSKVL